MIIENPDRVEPIFLGASGEGTQVMPSRSCTAEVAFPLGQRHSDFQRSFVKSFNVSRRSHGRSPPVFAQSFARNDNLVASVVLVGVASLLVR
jgi:hypothetical protein